MLAKYLEPQNYGIYSAAMAFGSLGAICLSFGFEGALNVHLPLLSDNLPKVRYLFQTLLKRRIFSVVLFFLIILIAGHFIEEKWLPDNIENLGRYLPLAILCGSISLLSGLLSIVLVAQFKAKYFSMVRIFFLISSLAVYAYLLINGFGIREILWATIATSFFAMLVYSFGCRDLLFGSSQRFSLNNIHKFGLTIWCNNIVASFLGKELDVIVMSLYGISAIQIGFYNIAFVLTSYVRMVVSRGMSGVLQSAYSTAYKRGGIRSLRKWWAITIKFQIVVVAPGVLTLILFAGNIFEVFLPDFRDATEILQITGAFIWVHTVLGGGTHITAFYAVGKEKTVLLTRMIAGLLNLLLDIILIYFYGVTGAIVATGVALVVVGILELGLSFHFLKATYPTRFFLKFGLCSLFSATVSWPFIGGNLVSLILCSFVFLISYVCAAWIVKPFDARDIEQIRNGSQHLGSFLTFFCRDAKLPV